MTNKNNKDLIYFITDIIMSHVNELRHKFHTLFTHFVDSIQKQTVSLGLCIGVHSQRKSYFIVKTQLPMRDVFCYSEADFCSCLSMISLLI